MRKRLADWLRVLVVWLDPPQVTPVLAPVDEDPMLLAARHLCRVQEDLWPDRSGESKRHQVYAALLKLFPDRGKRDVSKAIEEAL